MKTPPEKFRITPALATRLRIPPNMATDETCGCNGVFFIPRQTEIFHCIISDGEGWEHVSVSLRNRCPTWEEMCFIKDMFWGADECVMQLHPVRSEYVNMHSFCLHLWRPTGAAIPTPPSIMVGIPTISL
jgi:hypothetical protein